MLNNYPILEYATEKYIQDTWKRYLIAIPLLDKINKKIEQINNTKEEEIDYSSVDRLIKKLTAKPFETTVYFNRFNYNKKLFNYYCQKLTQWLDEFLTHVPEYNSVDVNYLSTKGNRICEYLRYTLDKLALGDDMDPINTITMSGLAAKYCEKFVFKDVSGLYKYASMPRDYFQTAVLGGRCMCANNKKLIICDELYDFDARSLYPSAIKRGWLICEIPVVYKSKAQKTWMTIMKPNIIRIIYHVSYKELMMNNSCLV
jgi:hypothetical protein